MDEIDPHIAAVVLDDVCERMPYLPRPDGLARLLVAAHNSPAEGKPGGLAAVVAVLWPIGAADGAERGHAVTLAGLLALLARIRTDELPDARARWIAAAFRQAALDLPAGANPNRTYHAPPVSSLYTSIEGLRSSIELGLGNGWRAGHDDASLRVLAAFNDAVDDLVGDERLATTFVTAGLPAYALLDEIGYLAYRFAERDRETPIQRLDPTTIVARSMEPFLNADRRDRARAFQRLGRVDPSRRTERRPRPVAGPHNRRRGR